MNNRTVTTVAIYGLKSSGKSSLLHRILGHEFNPDFTSTLYTIKQDKVVELTDGTNHTISFTDTNGDIFKYRMISTHLLTQNVYLYVFDPTVECFEQFELLQKLRSLSNNNPTEFIIINKIDLVSFENLQLFKQELNRLLSRNNLTRKIYTLSAKISPDEKFENMLDVCMGSNPDQYELNQMIDQGKLSFPSIFNHTPNVKVADNIIEVAAEAEELVIVKDILATASPVNDATLNPIDTKLPATLALLFHELYKQNQNFLNFANNQFEVFNEKCRTEFLLSAIPALNRMKRLYLKSKNEIVEDINAAIKPSLDIYKEKIFIFLKLRNIVLQSAKFPATDIIEPTIAAFTQLIAQEIATAYLPLEGKFVHRITRFDHALTESFTRYTTRCMTYLNFLCPLAKAKKITIFDINYLDNYYGYLDIKKECEAHGLGLETKAFVDLFTRHFDLQKSQIRLLQDGAFQLRNVYPLSIEQLNDLIAVKISLDSFLARFLNEMYLQQVRNPRLRQTILNNLQEVYIPVIKYFYHVNKKYSKLDLQNLRDRSQAKQEPQPSLQTVIDQQYNIIHNRLAGHEQESKHSQSGPRPAINEYTTAQIIEFNSRMSFVIYFTEQFKRFNTDPFNVLQIEEVKQFCDSESQRFQPDEARSDVLKEIAAPYLKRKHLTFSHLFGDSGTQNVKTIEASESKEEFNPNLKTKEFYANLFIEKDLSNARSMDLAGADRAVAVTIFKNEVAAATSLKELDYLIEVAKPYINRHRHSKIDSAFGIENTETWKSMLKLARETGLKSLQTHARYIDVPKATLEFWRKRDLFAAHRNNSIFKGAFGRTAAQTDIDVMIARARI